MNKLIALLRGWKAVFLYAITVTALTLLVLTDKLPVSKLLVNRDGFQAEFGVAAKEAQYKEYLAAAVTTADTPWIAEVGLFLLVNNEINVDGRTSRTAVEICAGLRFALLGLKESTCPPDDYSRVTGALYALERNRFVSRSRYANDQVYSFGVNPFGEYVLSGLRDKWTAPGSGKATVLGRMNIIFSNLDQTLIAARKWPSGT